MTLHVLTDKRSSRLDYVLRQIVKRWWGMEFQTYLDVLKFEESVGPKICYTQQRYPDSLWIVPSGLLSQIGVDQLDLRPAKDENKRFTLFTSTSGDLNYDPLSAVFYLLSRYEEYLPHIQDEYQRFTAAGSILTEYGVLRKPVVEHWCQELAQAIQLRFPDFKTPEKKLSVDILVYVQEAYRYRRKGILRQFGIFWSSVFSGKFRDAISCARVLVFNAQDPYDIYNDLLSQYRSAVKTAGSVSKQLSFFFQVGNYSTQDNNIFYQSKDYRNLLKMLNDYVPVGLLFSFFSYQDVNLMNTEHRRMEDILHVPDLPAMGRLSRLGVPYYPQDLLSTGVRKDYTMGYHDALGYRAGTSKAFGYYDLDTETSTPLVMHPVAVHARALDALETDYARMVAVKKMIKSTRNVGGYMRVALSNTDLAMMNTESVGVRILTKLLEIDA